MPRSTSSATRMTRRGALKTLFCSSVALAMNVRPQALSAAGFAEGDQHLLMIGDYGSNGKEQAAVARAMQKYAGDNKLKTEALLLLGDNFYSKMEGGLKSKRWTTGFEEMYPASSFPGPCWAILGNHDYHDNAGGEQTQLAYAKTGGTRWTLPAKWYRRELPQANPQVTFLFVDTNLPSVSGTVDAKTKKKKASLTVDEEKDRKSVV